MIFAIIISVITIICLISFILFKPSITIHKTSFDSFWIITLLGAFLLIVLGLCPLSSIVEGFFKDTPINPLKILIILLSMALVSIVLDELGFFNYIAQKTILIVGRSQNKLFFILYFLIAILTIFTSNDIIILTFTLFICYFCKKVQINPIPYLVMEFISANTYSMIFIIGNPTNIFLASANEIGFLEYTSVMFLPTILAGLSSIVTLYLLFRKSLKTPMIISLDTNSSIHNRSLMIIILIILSIQTILLAISSYLHIEMWMISLICFLTTIFILLIFSIITQSYTLIKSSVNRLPFNLMAFVISMFIIVLSLDYHNVFENISYGLNHLCINKQSTIFTYGVFSSLTDNIINNIPMSLTLSKIITYGNPLYKNEMIYSTIIGSNIGAFLTPIGALAGIMWMNILKKQEVNFSFLSFVKYGLILTPIILLFALLGLYIVL